MAAPFKLRSQGSPFKQIGSSPVKQDLGDPSKGKVKTNVPDKKEFIESLGGLKDPNYEKPFSIEDLHQKGGPREKGTPVKPKSEKRTEQEQPTTPTTPTKPKKEGIKKIRNLDNLTENEKKKKEQEENYNKELKEHQQNVEDYKRKQKEKSLGGRVKKLFPNIKLPF